MLVISKLLRFLDLIGHFGQLPIFRSLREVRELSQMIRFGAMPLIDYYSDEGPFHATDDILNKEVRIFFILVNWQCFFM